MPLKLLYISNQRFPTEKAYGIQITKMCEAFAFGGVEVELLIPDRGNPSGKDIFEFYGFHQNFKVLLTKSFDFYLPGILDKAAFFLKQTISALILSRVVFRKGYDIIFSRDEPLLYLLSFFRSGLCFEAHRFSARRSIFYRRFRNARVKIVVISEGLKKEFIKFGFDMDKILVSPDGVDLVSFNLPLSKEEARKTVGLSIDKKIALYAGQLFPQKGVYVAAKAAESVQDCLFVFIGGLGKYLRAFQKEFGEKENILILGQKSHMDIPLYLKAADLLLLPNSGEELVSKTYTSPLKLFEYMASRRPIIASDLPSIREVLNPHNSVLVVPDNPLVFANAVRSSLADYSKAMELADQALSDAALYTWQHRAESILKFIK